MDTDDLTDRAYAIIQNARGVNGLLGAELAVSSKDANSEQEFLRRMLKTLLDARQNAEDYLGDECDTLGSASELSTQSAISSTPFGHCLANEPGIMRIWRGLTLRCSRPRAVRWPAGRAGWCFVDSGVSVAGT